MQNLSNTSLGQYQLIEVIGRGRISTVYKAYQPALRRFVAIKVLQHLDLLGATRFEREAHMIARLHHPNILPIFDYGQQDDLRYFVTLYVEHSVTLSNLLSDESVDLVAALHMIKHLLAGLEYAHSHGIIHRDIKPSNILLPSPTWPLLADFGIAKLMDDLRQLTPPGQTVGTVAYMAPELARGLPADARSDLYSVGIVLYELLTGQVPFDGITPAAVLNMQIHAEPPRPRSLNRELPLEIEALLLHALAKDPAARYQSAADMATDLEQLAARLEHERTLAELLNVPAISSIATNYTTRKLSPDSRSTEAAELRGAAEQVIYNHPDPRPGNVRSTSAPKDRVAALGLHFSPLFILVIVVSLIGGGLAAFLLRSRTIDGQQPLRPATTQAARTPTSIVTPAETMGDSLPVFPAAVPGLPESSSPASPALPSLPPQEQASPALPLPAVTSTPSPSDQTVPTLETPLMPTLPQPDPSPALSPVPPAQIPIEPGQPATPPTLPTASA